MTSDSSARSVHKDPITVGASLKALLVTDLVDSTGLVLRAGDRVSSEVLLAHERLARDLLDVHGGLEIDKTDGFLLLFRLPVQAVRYALEYQRGLARMGEELGLPLEARAGIQVGEVIIRKNPPEDVMRGAKRFDVDGLTKAVAARLTSLARPRQVLLTRFTAELARRSFIGVVMNPPLRWMLHGDYQLQGLEDPVEVVEVGHEGSAPFEAPADTPKARRVQYVEPAAAAPSPPRTTVPVPAEAPVTSAALPAAPPAMPSATPPAAPVAPSTTARLTGGRRRALLAAAAVAILALGVFAFWIGGRAREDADAGAGGPEAASETAAASSQAHRISLSPANAAPAEGRGDAAADSGAGAEPVPGTAGASGAGRATAGGPDAAATRRPATRARTAARPPGVAGATTAQLGGVPAATETASPRATGVGALREAVDARIEPPKGSVSPAGNRLALISMELALVLFQQAHERLDVAALAELWPSLGGARLAAIERSFDRYRELRLDLQDCRFEIGLQTAVVECSERRRGATHEGARFDREARSYFHLRRQEYDWILEDYATAD